MPLIDVVIPELYVDTLTYNSPKSLKPGARVIVEIGKFFYTGFVIGESKKNLSSEIQVKQIKGIIDEEFISDYDIWNMAIWAGKICILETGRILRAVLPAPVITGEKIEPPPFTEIKGNFKERNYFNPFDKERVNFFVEELKEGKRTLILFSKKESAQKFFDNLPDNLKAESFLWLSMTGKKLFEAWRLINAKKFQIVIGSQSAVFAPLNPEKIIIEDEASPSYILQRTPKISARTLAGIRALYSGAELITAGNIPSLRTFKRSNPEEKFFPKRENIILADIFTSKKAGQKGIEGNIFLTLSLLKRTKRELINGNNVIWIFDRLGESSEVFCENCGKSIKCEKCGHVMRSETDGNILTCKTCGHIKNLPEKCGVCGYKFLKGKHPGIEALEKIAKSFYKNFKVNLYTKNSKKSKLNGLILSTQRGLELLSGEKINPSLIAWLDLDLELSGHEYDTRLKVFNLLWNSYWLGREINSERKILIQSRRNGMKLARFLSEGWSRFIPSELAEREEYNLPPYGINIEFECSDKIMREKIIEVFENEGFFIMDPGDYELPLTINENSVEKVSKTFNENFSMKEKKLIKIKIRSE